MNTNPNCLCISDKILKSDLSALNKIILASIIDLREYEHPVDGYSFRVISQSELSKRLNIANTHLSRNIKMLVELGALIAVPTDEISYLFVLYDSRYKAFRINSAWMD